jgi:hypothetical protein
LTVAQHDAVAKKFNIAPEFMAKVFSHHIALLDKKNLDPTLSDVEKRYVACLNKITRHAIDQGYLVTKAEDGPDNSSWANSVRNSDKEKMQR